MNGKKRVKKKYEYLTQFEGKVNENPFMLDRYNGVIEVLNSEN